MNTAKYTLEDKLAYAQHKADQARERLAAGEKRREAARDLGGGLLSFGGSGSQRARRQVQSATERATNAVGEALAAIKYWDGKVSGYERRIVERDRALLHPREVSTMRTVPVKRGIRTHRRRRAGLWRWGHSVPKHVRLGLPGPTFDA